MTCLTASSRMRLTASYRCLNSFFNGVSPSPRTLPRAAMVRPRGELDGVGWLVCHAEARHRQKIG